MYRVDKRVHRHKRAKRSVLAVIIVLITGGIIYGLFQLRITPDQEIRNAPPVSTKYNPDSMERIAVDKPELSLSLPEKWKEIQSEDRVHVPTYSFQSESTPGKTLNIFIDNPPVTMPLNHAIAVTAQGDSIVNETVSNNCTTFTDSAKTDRASGIAPARWQGKDFYCDMSNFNRAVVGIISGDGINQLKVSGVSGREYTVFLSYIDNSINPDYTTLYSILSSLHFK